MSTTEALAAADARLASAATVIAAGVLDALTETGWSLVHATTVEATPSTFQGRVLEHLNAVTQGDPTDLAERRDRAGEEHIELQQSLGATREGLHALVDYVFDRPAGEPGQEFGGSMTTLAGLAIYAGHDLMACAEAELARTWSSEVFAKIRRKRAGRHGRGPLPGVDGGAATKVIVSGGRHPAEPPIPDGEILRRESLISCPEAVRAVSDHDGKRWRVEGAGWTMQPVGCVDLGEAEAICRAVERALTVPVSSKDQIQSFVEDCLVAERDAFLPVGEAYFAYEDWCATKGLTPFRGTTFSRRLCALLSKRAGPGGVCGVAHVALKDGVCGFKCGARWSRVLRSIRILMLSTATSGTPGNAGTGALIWSNRQTTKLGPVR